MVLLQQGWAEVFRQSCTRGIEEQFIPAIFGKRELCSRGAEIHDLGLQAFGVAGMDLIPRGSKFSKEGTIPRWV